MLTRRWVRAAAACVVGVLLLPAPGHAAPCAAARCTEWIALGSLGARSLAYRSFPLHVKNTAVVRAVVIVHDTWRDARGAFDVALAAAARAGALGDTVVVAPRFSSSDGDLCRDHLAPREVNWPCVGDSWRSGGLGSGVGVPSFAVVDEILLALARRDVFPNLRAIVVAGHSAGGQFVTRYAMGNRVHERLGVSVSYAVANPSSYAYLDDVRPVTEQGGTAFQPFAGAKGCPGYDSWPYGLSDRPGDARLLPAAELRRQAAGRPTTYLLGERDVVQDGTLDTSCAAMAQGPTRLDRGLAFSVLVNGHFGGHHAVAVIPGCGHDAQCVFTADAALPVLFGGSRRSSAPAAN